MIKSGELFVLVGRFDNVQYATIGRTQDGYVLFSLGTRESPECNRYCNKIGSFQRELTVDAVLEKGTLYKTGLNVNSTRPEPEVFVTEENNLCPVPLKMGMIFQLKDSQEYYVVSYVMEKWTLTRIDGKGTWSGYYSCIDGIFQGKRNKFTYLPNAKIVIQ